MATRILVPFDGSASAMRALDHAIAETKGDAGADLQLLIVQGERKSNPLCGPA